MEIQSYVIPFHFDHLSHTDTYLKLRRLRDRIWCEKVGRRTKANINQIVIIGVDLVESIAAKFPNRNIFVIVEKLNPPQEFTSSKGKSTH